MTFKKPDECDWVDRGIIGRHVLDKKMRAKLCQLCGRRHARLGKLTSRLAGNVSFTLKNGVACTLSKIDKHPNVRMSFIDHIVDFVNPHKYRAFAGVKVYLFEFTIANKKLGMFASCDCPYYIVEYLLGTLKIINSNIGDYWVFEGKRYSLDESSNAPLYEKEKYTRLFTKAIETNTPPEIVALYGDPS